MRKLAKITRYFVEEPALNPGLCYLTPFPLVDTKIMEEVFYSLSTQTACFLTSICTTWEVPNMKRND